MYFCNDSADLQSVPPKRINSKVNINKKASDFSEAFLVAPTEQMSNHFIEDLERLVGIEVY
jgi:hypothetical protein